MLQHIKIPSAVLKFVAIAATTCLLAATLTGWSVDGTDILLTAASEGLS